MPPENGAHQPTRRMPGKGRAADWPSPLAPQTLLKIEPFRAVRIDCARLRNRAGALSVNDGIGGMDVAPDASRLAVPVASELGLVSPPDDGAVSP